MDEPIDWMRVVIHGLIGAVFGAAAGFGAWAFAFTEINLALWLGAWAIAVGLVAAIWGDRFWTSLKENQWWNPFDWL